ncbi:MAG TPA: MMPL family transporter, partial [Cytophagaceae bacterium]
MSQLFISLYNYFLKRRLLLGLILAALVSFSLFFASKIKLQEDISRMMPQDDKISKINLVFQNSKFSDKLIVNIYLKDTLSIPNPDLLSEFSDEYVAALRNLPKGLVKEVTHKISEDVIFDVYNSVYDNIPLFLGQSDYNKIDELVSDTQIDSSLGKNYRTLISPSSFILKQFILKDPIGLTSIGLKKMQGLQIEDNYEIHNENIFTKDKKHLILFITPARPPNETAHNAKLINGLDQISDSLNQKYSYKIKSEYLGAAAVSVGNSERIKKDVNVTVIIAVSILVLFISLFFGRINIVFLIFLPVLIGGILSVGLLYFFKSEFSAIALGMGSVLLGITIDYSLHIFTHYRSTGSVKEVLKDLSTPLMLSCFITAASFLCLLFVKSEALRELGLFAALSVVCAAFTALIVLPHLLKKDTAKSKKKEMLALSFIDRYTAYEFDKNKALIFVIIFISVVSVFTARKVSFENDLMKMNYMSEKLNSAQQHLNSISSLPLNSIYIVSNGKSLDDALRYNEEIIVKIDSLKSAGLIKKYSSPSLLLLSQDLQRQRINLWNSYWTRSKKDSLKIRLQLYSKKYRFKEDAFEEFYGLLNKDYQPVNLSSLSKLRSMFLDDYITENNEMSTVVNLLKVDVKNKDKIFASFAETAHTTIIDRKYIANKFVALLNADFNLLEILSLAMVFAVLIISYGRLELGIIAFLPLALSWLWTLGLMGLLGIKFNILNIIISTFILGLGIDYSIFIMSGLLQEYSTGKQHLATYKTSIFLSAFTTIVGVGSLFFAKHPALQSIATLSIIGMFSIIIISYTIAPLLFKAFITNRTAQKKDPFTVSTFLCTSFAYLYFFFGCLLLGILGLVFIRLNPFFKKRLEYLFHVVLMYFARSMVYIMVNVKKQVRNIGASRFSEPSVIIANHQSFLDILLILMVHPKIVMVTNDWVWNSPFFGSVVKMASFFPSSKGSEHGLEFLKGKVTLGYSIMIFPEGTRSSTGEIGRFHKGAFFLAEKLGLDIMPILFHGTGDTISKGDFMLKNNVMTMVGLPRILIGDLKFGSGYS